MKNQKVFELKVSHLGLVDIIDHVVYEKPEPTKIKFMSPNSDGPAFRKNFEALKEGDFITVIFPRKKE